MIITESVTPPDEFCEDRVEETTRSFSPPPEIIDCPDPYCGRLIGPLRVAARTKDAGRFSPVPRSRATGPGTPAS